MTGRKTHDMTAAEELVLAFAARAFAKHLTREIEAARRADPGDSGIEILERMREMANDLSERLLAG